ncbi:hypothetical protein TSUD_22850 [Trifolium subterraneum]|uniref:Uncharacterized protein n=1 Tax=Trifolium subterraneum TaxID=3900 RepID=A0A2Z6P2I4_TRISU|nr:hypothetical protein TSUD_22850 [Trifolium subterraneum]
MSKNRKMKNLEAGGGCFASSFHLSYTSLGHKAAPPHPHPSPNPNFKESPHEHPIEVIARIRDHQIPDFGYRDFTLDGVSVSEEEDLDLFYKKFVESRINGVK